MKQSKQQTSGEKRVEGTVKPVEDRGGMEGKVE